MKIGIIGAGSIGLLFAGYLGKRYDVTIFPRTDEQAQSINTKGITVKIRDSYFTVKVKGTSQRKNLKEQDLIIVAVKQFQLNSIISDLTNLPKIPVLFLQNGMGHLQILERMPNTTIILGSVEHGASKVNDTVVMHNGIGKTNISMYKGEYQSPEPLLLSSEDDFPFRYSKDYEDILTKKLIVNAMINPLTAILNVKNGALLSNPNYFQIFQDLYHEVIPLFSNISRDMMMSDIVQICSNTKENESSMLKDIKNGTRTEIDAILGVILQRAQEKSKRVPITWSLYQMIKGMEREGENT